MAQVKANTPMGTERIDSQLLAMAERMDAVTGVVGEAQPYMESAPVGLPPEDAALIAAVVAELSKMSFMTEVTPELLREALLLVIGRKPIAEVLRGTPIAAARRIALSADFEDVLAAVARAEASDEEQPAAMPVREKPEGK